MPHRAALQRTTVHIVRLCAVLPLAIACAMSAAVAAPRQGTVEHRTLPAPSIGDPARSVRVYLPPSYHDPAAASRRYPVLVLLHGWPGGDGNWEGHGRAAVTLDSLIARDAIPELIALMPNGAGVGLLGRSLYLNSYDGRSRMEDFVARDLIVWAYSVYRTLADPGHRGILGLSEGGSGALNIAFHHPEVFGACAGLSGQYRLARDMGMSAVFGPEPGATRLREANSPTLYVDRIAPQLRRQAIYFDCGAGDELRDDNRALDRKLTALGVPHVYREFPGTHGWGYWKVHLRDALLVIGPRMR